MKVLLRDIGTSQFVGQPAPWTEQMENARAFGGLTDALFYCYNHDLVNMEILCESEETQMHCKVPLPEL